MKSQGSATGDIFFLSGRQGIMKSIHDSKGVGWVLSLKRLGEQGELYHLEA